MGEESVYVSNAPRSNFRSTYLPYSWLMPLESHRRHSHRRHLQLLNPKDLQARSGRREETAWKLSETSHSSGLLEIHAAKPRTGVAHLDLLVLDWRASENFGHGHLFAESPKPRGAESGAAVGTTLGWRSMRQQQ